MTATLSVLKQSSCSAASRRSIAYLFVPRSTRHFTPALISSISDTDAIRSYTSKKEPEIRADEIRKAASTDLLPLLEQDNELIDYVTTAASSLVISDVLLESDGGGCITMSSIWPYPKFEIRKMQCSAISFIHSPRGGRTVSSDRPITRFAFLQDPFTGWTFFSNHQVRFTFTPFQCISVRQNLH